MRVSNILLVLAIYTCASSAFASNVCARVTAHTGEAGKAMLQNARDSLGLSSLPAELSRVLTQAGVVVSLKNSGVHIVKDGTDSNKSKFLSDYYHLAARSGAPVIMIKSSLSQKGFDTELEIKSNVQAAVDVFKFLSDSEPKLKAGNDEGISSIISVVAHRLTNMKMSESEVSMFYDVDLRKKFLEAIPPGAILIIDYAENAYDNRNPYSPTSFLTELEEISQRRIINVVWSLPSKYGDEPAGSLNQVMKSEKISVVEF